MFKVSDYIKIGEAAKFLGVTICTFRNWEKKNKIKVYRNPFNNHRMYKKEELERILKEIEDTLCLS